ncbi:MAG: O-antigen ligase family protein [Pseudomonadota bacterium]|nr:O-antigen ligase family protein [Pseudomonadota bacterium]
MSIDRRRFTHALQEGAFALFCLLPLLLALTRAGADIALCLIGAMFLLYCAVEKHWRWLALPEFRALGILWIYLMLHALAAPEIVASFSTALVWGRFIPFAAASFWLLDRPGALHKVCRTNLAILALLLVDGGWQYITGTSLSGHRLWDSVRLSGPLTHPNLGNLILKVALPTMGLWTYETISRRRPLLPVIIFALMLMALVLVSGERTISILMLLAIGVMGALVFLREPQLRKHVLLGAIALVALLALLATQHVVQSRFHELVMNLSNFRHSPYGQLYTNALALWIQQPLFGIGAGEFRYLCLSVMIETSNSYCDIHPHNMYLEWLVSGGVVALAVFLLAMGLITRRFLREASFRHSSGIPAMAGVGTLVALLFPFAVTQSVFANWAGIVFWYSLSLAVNLPHVAGEHD